MSDVGEVESESHFLLYTERVFSENPEIFWCPDDKNCSLCFDANTFFYHCSAKIRKEQKNLTI